MPSTKTTTTTLLLTRREMNRATFLVTTTGMTWDKAVRQVTAETRKREERRRLAIERSTSQVSGFVLTFGELLDHWLPFGLGKALARCVVRRRIERRLERLRAA